jgi:hypothetical protein
VENWMTAPGGSGYPAAGIPADPVSTLGCDRAAHRRDAAAATPDGIGRAAPCAGHPGKDIDVEVTELQAAELLGVPVAQVVALIEEGAVPARQVSLAEQVLAGSPAEWRLDREDLEALLDQLASRP